MRVRVNCGRWHIWNLFIPQDGYVTSTATQCSARQNDVPNDGIRVAIITFDDINDIALGPDVLFEIFDRHGSRCRRGSVVLGGEFVPLFDRDFIVQ
jgi:hypothetical protein